MFNSSTAQTQNIENIFVDMMSEQNREKIIFKLRKGDLTVEELRAVFKDFVEKRDLIMIWATYEYKIKDFKKMGFGLIRRYSKKSEYVDAYCDNFLEELVQPNQRDLVWSPMTEKWIEYIERRLYAITQEDIKSYATEVETTRAERKKELEELKRKLSNPKTMEDFRTFFHYYPPEKLTNDQLSLYDELVSTNLLEKIIEEKEERLKRVVDINMNINNDNFRGDNGFLVTLSERVEKEDFFTLKARAKSLDGFYTRSLRGFFFYTSENAQQFADQKPGEVKESELNIERLRDTAQGRIEKAVEEISRERLVNTSRRAIMAERVKETQEKIKLIAELTMNLGEAISEKKVKHLKYVRFVSHVEELLDIIKDVKRKAADKFPWQSEERQKIINENWSDEWLRYYQYPFPSIQKDRALDIYNQFKNVKGCIQKANRFYKLWKRCKGDYIVLSGDDIKMISIFQRKAKKSSNDNIVYIFNNYQRWVRLQKMKLSNISMLRAALRELSLFLPESGTDDRPSKIRKAETDLVITCFKGDDFFPTPEWLAEIIVDKAELHDNDRVMEPQAGKGDIADIIRGRGLSPECIEISTTLRNILLLKGHRLTDRDFLSHRDTVGYDAIIMNPPFSDRRDEKHFRHAYSMLRPGGRISAMLGPHSFISKRKSESEFIQWLESIGANYTEYKNAFNDKKSPWRTGTSCYHVFVKRDGYTKNKEREEYKIQVLRLWEVYKEKGEVSDPYLNEFFKSQNGDILDDWPEELERI